MRYETCLACRTVPAAERHLYVLTITAELLSGETHHHHTVTCGACGRWWFDDVIIGGFSLPVTARRDTVFCGCDENLPQYTRGVVLIPGPEADCRCTASKINDAPLLAELGPS